MFLYRPSDDAHPTLLPHFELQGQDVLCKLDDRTPLRLSPQECEVLAMCDGKLPANRLPGGVHSHELHRMFRLGLLVSLPAPRARNRHSRRLCVLAPHHDDAALSVGGYLLEVASGIEITIACLASESRYSVSTALSADSRTVSALRSQEETLYARLLWANTRSSGIRDAQLRTNAEEGSMLGPARPSVDVQHQFDAAIQSVLDEVRPDVVMAPLAIGDHPDHIATFIGTLRAMDRVVELGAEVLWYEDLPYSATHYLELLARLRRAAAAGAQPMPGFVDLSKRMVPKSHGITIYRSQPYNTFLNDIIRYARLCGTESHAPFAMRERIWRFEGETDVSKLAQLAPEPAYSLAFGGD